MGFRRLAFIAFEVVFTSAVSIAAAEPPDEPYTKCDGKICTNKMCSNTVFPAGTNVDKGDVVIPKQPKPGDAIGGALMVFRTDNAETQVGFSTDPGLYNGITDHVQAAVAKQLNANANGNPQLVCLGYKNAKGTYKCQCIEGLLPGQEVFEPAAGGGVNYVQVYQGSHNIAGKEYYFQCLVTVLIPKPAMKPGHCQWNG